MIKDPKMIKSHFAPSFYLNNMLNDLQRVRSNPQSIGAMVAQTYMAATDSGSSTQDKRSWHF